MIESRVVFVRVDMSSAVVRCLVERIHQAGSRYSLICSGAGASMLASLTSVPGCSQALIEAQCPYHSTAVVRLLDYLPNSFVHPSVGTSLAQSAFHQCRSMGEPNRRVVGLGVTAAIATNRVRFGANSAFVSCWTATGVTNYRLELEKYGDRAAQESCVARAALLALAEGVNAKWNDLDLQLPRLQAVQAGDTLKIDDSRVLHRWFVPHTIAPLQALLSGGLEAVVINRNGAAKCHGLPPFVHEDVLPERCHYLLYPGSFNPLHWGHTELARTASTVVQSARDPPHNPRPVVITYEVAVSRIGKHDFSPDELTDQIKQFTQQGHRVAMTTAKLFIDKARLFPHHGMVVGIDTVVRVLDPQYYGGSLSAMIDAMKRIKAYDCYFVVGGRIREGEWVDLSSVPVPHELQDMFIPIPQELFRVDISSTEIRKRRQK